jgi:formate dehydrogenase maturation protein FdhE
VSLSGSHVDLDPVRRTIAEQMSPLVDLQRTMTMGWPSLVDRVSARARLQTGHTAFDPLEIIGSAGDLIVPFIRVTVALEQCGVTTDIEASRARDERYQVLSMIASWLSGDSMPRDPVKATAWRAAMTVGASILRRASVDVRGGKTVTGWAGMSCPCCGGTADLALAHSEHRVLICSRCDGRWQAHRSRCLGCAAEGPPQIARVSAPLPGYELSICNQCGRYLKERHGSGDLDLLVERALTAQMDAAAEMRGLRP